MKFELQALRYESDALEPTMSRETVELHWGKHLLTYINNLNGLIADRDLDDATLESIIKSSDGAIYNNAGQVLNHQMMFDQFSPNPQTTPSGALAVAIAEQFGSFEAFVKKFEGCAMTLFGSGWAWLSNDRDGVLHITQEPNGDNPLRRGLSPLMCVDVWEHAYYVDYQNRRAEYLSKIWHIIDWAVIDARYIDEI